MWGYLWFWGPGGMTPATLDSVYPHLARAINHPEVKDLFAKGGSEAAALPPPEMMRVARDLHERWGAVIRTLGVTLD
jgi:tripartite-type tricarboxylate transporter receptor subunit TctC